MDPIKPGEGAIFKAFSRLPADVREILTRVVIDGSSVDEVSADLQLDSGHVRQRLEEGTRLLAQEMSIDDLRRKLR